MRSKEGGRWRMKCNTGAWGGIEEAIWDGIEEAIPEMLNDIALFF